MTKNQRTTAKQAIEDFLQGRHFQVTGDFSTHYHRNTAGLLGHHDHDRINQFGQADGSTVARSELRTDIRILSQRQETPGPGNPPALEDQGPVMHRRSGVKDRKNQST
jgi:hypothetical protein